VSGGTGAARIRRISGPLVEFDHSGGVAMHELIALGREAVLGEVVEIRDGTARTQAYEYTGGLVPGDPVGVYGGPLSARLGPGLLGGVFDGLLRPLSTAGTFLTGAGQSTADDGRRWEFEPRMRAGEHARPGDVLGLLHGGGPVEHRVLVPADTEGTLTAIAPRGGCADTDELASVGATPVRAVELWPVRRPRPSRGRAAAVEPLHTGQRAIDLLFPIPRGGTAAVPGGFGTGKTMLLQQIAKWCAADVIVYVGCGERGNEMAEVVAELAELADPRTGGRIIDRTVVVANTSNMPMMAREASIHTGVTVAEYFRDMGHDAVVIADSTSRWAEAMREFASRSGALPAEEGYPADLASTLAAFYERAGLVQTLGGGNGSVTIVGAVSPPGGDMTEPVTVFTERFVRCRWMLDRELAYARHYPAISWSGSFSRDVAAIAEYHARSGDEDWASRRGRVVGLLAEADQLGALADLVGIAALPDHQRVVVLAGRLAREAVLQQNSLSAHDASSTPDKTAALVDALLSVVDALLAAVRTGVPAGDVERLDLTPFVRAREETAPDDATGVHARRDVVLARIRELTP
jgi:V/A-type H+-transporting ATPase subunit A